MIRQGYKCNKPRVIRKKLFDYESMSSVRIDRTLPIRHPNEYLNMCSTEGALRDEDKVITYTNPIGAEYPVLNKLIMNSYFYMGEDGESNLLVAMTNSGIYVINLMDEVSVKPEWTNIYPIPLSNAVEFRIDGKNILTLAGNNVMITYDGTTVTVKQEGERPPCKVLRMCNHFGRMFVTEQVDRYKLWFSDEINPFNFTQSAYEGGYLNVEISCGKIIDIVSFNEFLYVILERGIMRLRAYGDQSEFQLKRLDVFTGDIIPSTIALCGASIVFLSTCGLMQFDGYACKPLFPELTEMLNDCVKKRSTFVNTCYAENTYYLSYIDKGKNRLLKVALNKGRYSIIDIGDYRGLARAIRKSEDVLLYCRNDLPSMPNLPLAYLSKDTEKLSVAVYKAMEIDFYEPSKIKVIRTIEPPSGFKGALAISTRGNKKVFELSGKQLVDVNIEGYVFDFELTINASKFDNYSPIVTVNMPS